MSFWGRRNDLHQKIIFMTKEEIALLELLKFTVNQKAIQAGTFMKMVGTGSQIWEGQYMAFMEMYSILSSFTDSTILKCDICGCTPIIIVRTPKGNFCQEHERF